MSYVNTAIETLVGQRFSLLSLVDVPSGKVCTEITVCNSSDVVERFLHSYFGLRGGLLGKPQGLLCCTATLATNLHERLLP